MLPRVFAMLFGPMLTAPAVAQECLTQVATHEVGAKLSTAEAAFTSLDLDRFDLVLADIQLTLPCVDSVVDPTLAAHFHRVQGIRHFLDTSEGAQDQAVLWAHAALSIEPDFDFGVDVLPRDHELRTVFAQGATRAERSRRAREPREFELYFDGEATRMRPTSRPTLVQFVGDQGLDRTLLLMPSDPLPDYRAVPHIRRRLWQSSAVLGGLAAGTYGASWISRARFQSDKPSDLQTLERLRGTTNAFGYSAIGLASSAGLIAVTGLLVGER